MRLSIKIRLWVRTSNSSVAAETMVARARAAGAVGAIAQVTTAGMIDATMI